MTRDIFITGELEMIGSDGKTYTVIVYTIAHSFDSEAGHKLLQWVSMKTSDDQYVERIEKGKYRLCNTEVILTSTDAKAP